MTRTTNWQSLHNDEAKFATKPLFEAAVTQWEILVLKFGNNWRASYFRVFYLDFRELSRAQT